MIFSKIFLAISQKPKAKPAFTILEMMVSLSIITIITSLFIANYRTGNKRSDLTMTAQVLVSDLHLAQNNTLGLVKYNGSVPSGGWGISFDTSKNNYTIFADLDTPTNVLAGPTGYLRYEAATEGQVNYGARTTSLPTGIQIDSLKVGAATSSLVDAGQSVNVTFLPPDPQTNIYASSTHSTSSMLEITLKELRNGTIKTVRVNFLGLAEVIN